MRVIGIALMVVGIITSLIAFALKTTVTNIGTYVGDQLVGAGDTYNLGLLQQQTMVLHTGLAMFLAGAIFASARSGDVLPQSEVERAAVVRDVDAQQSDRILYWMIGGLFAVGAGVALLASLRS